MMAPPQPNDLLFAAARSSLRRSGAGVSVRLRDERYQDFVDNAVHGFYRTSLEGEIVYANSAMAAMLGFVSREDLLGLNIAEHVYSDPNDRDVLVEEYQFAAEVREVEVQWKRSTGEVFAVELNGRPLVGESGRTTGFEMMAQDVSGRHTLEAQLRQSQKMEALGSLAGGVAHDLNNMLLAVSGFSELVREDLAEGTEALTNVDHVLSAARRAAGVVQQILAFARPSEPKVTLGPLHDIVAESTKLLGATVPKTIQIEEDFDVDAGPVSVDHGQVVQVLLNLGTNAAAAMNFQGKINVSVKQVEIDAATAAEIGNIDAGTHVCVAVKDHGCGIDPLTLERIFHPFFTTKGIGEGTGLGLSVVHGIVLNHSAGIEVESVVGDGTEFRVYFPVCRSVPLKRISQPIPLPGRRRGDGANGQTGVLNH